MSDFLFNFEDADDNDDFTESDSDGFWTGKDATIFVIDASPEMFTKPSVSNQGEDEEDCPFIKSLRVSTLLKYFQLTYSSLINILIIIKY